MSKMNMLPQTKRQTTINRGRRGQQRDSHTKVFTLLAFTLGFLCNYCSQFTVNVMKFIQPTVIFSAHDHHGMDYVGTRKTGRSTGNITLFSQNKPETEDEFLLLKPPSILASKISWHHGIQHNDSKGLFATLSKTTLYH